MKKLLLTLCLFLSTLTGFSAEKIFDTVFTARNFNTSPLTISNLKGDTYDYEIICVFFPAVTTTGQLFLYANADKTANYRSYYMLGASSTASANTSDTASIFDSLASNNGVTTHPSIFMGRITGSSGGERYLDDVLGYYSGSTSIIKRSKYWKNTADELTSLLIESNENENKDVHIIIYRTLKVSGQGRWELMKELSWSSEAVAKSFTGLSGDTDKQYRVTWDGDVNPGVILNNDTGTNYITQRLRNSSGTISAVNNTGQTSWLIRAQSSIVINAESGVDRVAYSTSANTTSFQQEERANWWSNTADEITSIKINIGVSATGTAKLYRMKNKFTTADTLPFEIVKTVAVSGDFSAGHTFSGLSGDDYKMIKIECLGHNTSGNTTIFAQINGDTGSNYAYQFVSGANSTTSAGTGTTTTFQVGRLENGDMGVSEAFIYPSSGDNRPILERHGYDEDTILLRSAWWLNSVDEITSIKIYAANTNVVTATFKLSILK